MQNQINQEQHPYGLGGGTILTGSMSISGEFFWFYPVSASVATLKLSSPEGIIPSTTYTNGVSVYGVITEVTQSSGTSIVYLGAPSEPRYNTFAGYPSLTPSISVTISVTPSRTPPLSVSKTPSISTTPSITATPSVTPSISTSIPLSISRTPSVSASTVPPPSVSRTPSITPSPSRP